MIDDDNIEAIPHELVQNPVGLLFKAGDKPLTQLEARTIKSKTNVIVERMSYEYQDCFRGTITDTLLQFNDVERWIKEPKPSSLIRLGAKTPSQAFFDEKCDKMDKALNALPRKMTGMEFVSLFEYWGQDGYLYKGYNQLTLHRLGIFLALAERLRKGDIENNDNIVFNQKTRQWVLSDRLKQFFYMCDSRSFLMVFCILYSQNGGKIGQEVLYQTLLELSYMDKDFQTLWYNFMLDTDFYEGYPLPKEFDLDF